MDEQLQPGLVGLNLKSANFESREFRRDEPYAGERAEIPEPPRREISIQPLDSGYIVRVGCQSIAVQDKDTLIRNLVMYITDPAEYEKNYYNRSKKLI